MMSVHRAMRLTTEEVIDELGQNPSQHNARWFSVFILHTLDIRF